MDAEYIDMCDGTTAPATPLNKRLANKRQGELFGPDSADKERQSRQLTIEESRMRGSKSRERDLFEFKQEEERNKFYQAEMVQRERIENLEARLEAEMKRNERNETALNRDALNRNALNENENALNRDALNRNAPNY